MPGTSDVRYLVLADRAVPYLLARVRWPDVAQAISGRSPDWLEDPGLFDLPYDPSVIRVSFPQAASVAAGWGRQLQPEVTGGALSYMRRMPANWSDLSPSERHAWGIEFAGKRRSLASPRGVRRLRSSQAKMAASAAPRASALASPPTADGNGQVAHVTSGPSNTATERRRHMRVRVDGRAHIRSGHATVSAGLVDLSEGGMHCVLPGAVPGLARGARLDGPFLLETDVTTWRICLNVAGWIAWHRSTAADTHFGVVFDTLDRGEILGVRRFLAAAVSRRGS